MQTTIDLATIITSCREVGITEFRGIVSVKRMVESGRTLDDAISAYQINGPVLPAAPVESPYRPVSFTVVGQNFIIFPRPEIQFAYHAEWTLANGTTKRCSHNHSREDLAAKCGRRSVRKGNTWE